MEFNQENIDKKIADIKSLPDKERAIVCESIKKDIAAWIKKEFSVDKTLEILLKKWPVSHKNETAFGISTALNDKNWSLKVVMPSNPPSAMRKCTHQQEVKGEVSPLTGEYSVSKTHTWSW